MSYFLKDNKVPVLIICALVFLAGCHMVRTPPAPSLLQVDTAKTEQAQEARSFADDFIKDRKRQGKPTADAKATAAKIKDPAWKSIQKQRINSEKNFTLTELVDMALNNNPQTRQDWEQTRVARAQEKQAESLLYPQLTIAQTITRQKQVSNIAGNSINNSYYGPSAQLTYLLLDFGGRTASIESKFQKVLEANAQYDQSLQDLIRDVQKTYYAYYSAQSLVEASELDVKNTKTDYDAAQAKFDVGLVAKLDVLQAKSDYENSLYNLESAKGQVKSTKADLAKVIGVSADTNFDIVAPVKDVPTGVTEEDVSRLIEESLSKRPDIKAFQADLKSKKAAARAAFSDVLPNLNLGASAQQDRYRYYNSGGLKDNQRDYSAYLSVNWNVFDGFNNWNKKKEADYQAAIAFDKLVQAELDASSDVWVKYYDFSTAVQKLKFSRSYLETSENSYDLALESYNAGLKSILDLVQSQSNLSQARSRLIQAKKDVFTSLAELAHSTGTPNIKIGLEKDK